MERAELERRLADLEERRFYLDMKDHWSRADFDRDDELAREIREIKAKLAEM